MSRPVQSAGRVEPRPLARAELARVWARALDSTAYVPSSRREVEQVLRELLDSLFDTLTGDRFSPGLAREVGVRLVTEYFTSEQSLSRTVEVLGQALPVSPELREIDRIASKVATLLGAVSAGFAAALRARTLDQQEQVKLALLQARQEAERELRVSEARFRELFTSSAVGIAISDLEGTLQETNEALGEIIGIPPGKLAGRCLYDLLHTTDAPLLRTVHQDLVTGRRTRSRLPQRFRLVGKDGELARAYLAVSLLHDADGAPAGLVTIVEDVTELHLLGERLRHQSLHDALTGLPNQQFFITSLERAIGQGTRITLCTIDLDGFAVVNDAFGRQVGDRLLHLTAQRLQSVVADEQATVARFSADSFAIFIENSPTTPDAATLAARIHSELAEPLYIDGHGLALTCGIGIAEHRGGRIEPGELLRAAESALRGAKNSSKHQWGLFDPQRDADHRARCQLAASMPGAWENGEVSLEYQPLARLADGTVFGIQALLRWDHPQHGPIRHQECVDLATRTGLVLPLGQWMLHAACEQFASWQQRQRGTPPMLHIDLTPEHADDPDLVRTVTCALNQAGLRADGMQLGIPEATLGTEPGDAAENLNVLADLGVAITLLGCSGMTTIAHLEDLPAVAVELAPQVVDRVTIRGATSAVGRSVMPLLQLIHCCARTVIVRGIDNQDQADWWRAAGADIGQGRFFAPPAELPRSG